MWHETTSDSLLILSIWVLPHTATHTQVDPFTCSLLPTPANLPYATCPWAFPTSHSHPRHVGLDGHPTRSDTGLVVPTFTWDSSSHILLFWLLDYWLLHTPTPPACHAPTTTQRMPLPSHCTHTHGQNQPLPTPTFHAQPVAFPTGLARCYHSTGRHLLYAHSFHARTVAHSITHCFPTPPTFGTGHLPSGSTPTFQDTPLDHGVCCLNSHSWGRLHCHLYHTIPVPQWVTHQHSPFSFPLQHLHYIPFYLPFGFTPNVPTLYPVPSFIYRPP